MEMTIILLALLPMVACLITSGILCYKDKDGWGWFLFVGFLLATVFETVIKRFMEAF